MDRFQIDAIHALDAGKSVIVGAPAGTGKTLIADYLIEHCLVGGRYAVYTTPTKAQSNQKFREWSDRFGSQVGMVTGDVSIHPNAPIRVMTTETYRKAIFSAPGLLNAAAYVIFDDLHDMNNETYGTVWEESILFGPPHIKLLCLSLPLPNLNELGQWIAHLRQLPHGPPRPPVLGGPQGVEGQDVAVIQETERPVPREHAWFIPRYGIGTLAAIEEIKAASAEKQRQLLSRMEADVVKLAGEQGQLPALYFCQNRKRCEDLAFDYAERNLISLPLDPRSRYDALCHECEIAENESVATLRQCVACGIAYHHAGLLPTLQAIIEHMFAEGHIQLLFTTSVFTLAKRRLNLHANTVIIDQLEKFDGTRWRYLKPEEYDQMVGRARRGGHVYVCVDPLKTDLTTVNQILNGDFEPLTSYFDPCYATILNLYERQHTTNQQINDPTNLQSSVEKSFRSFRSLDQLNEIDQQATAHDDEELLPVECVYDQPHLIVEYQRLSEALAPQKTAVKKRQRESKRAKGDQKQVVIEDLNQLQKAVDETEAARNALLCASCPHRGECMRRSQKLQKAERTTNRLVQQKASVVDATRDEMNRRIAFLESLGYIHDGQLTPKGHLAKRFYGAEIQLTELLFDGYFDQLDEVQVNVLTAAISFEPQTEGNEQKHTAKQIDFDFANLERRMQRLAERQRAFGIESAFKMLDAGLSRVVHAWSEGSELADFNPHVATPHGLRQTAEGDIIRELRDVVELLRQLENALPEGTELREKIARCIGRLNRGEVKSK